MVSKKESNKNIEVKKEVVENRKETNIFTNYLTNVKYQIVVLVVVALLIAGYFINTKLTVATVNGEAISRLKLISLLEKQGGKQVLDSLVTETLIMQEAKKQNVEVNDEELAKKVKSIEDRFVGQQQSFDEILAMQGMTRDDLNDQIRLQLLVEKMASGSADISEAEIDKYIADNKEMMPEETDTTTEEFRNQIKDSLKSEKSNTQINDWLLNLKTKAEIKYLKTY